MREEETPSKPRSTRRALAGKPAASSAARARKPRAAAVAQAQAPHGSNPALGAEQRRRLIAEAAYYLAERRGFQGGSPEQDWLEAEARIDAAHAHSGSA
jgi:hypothetical protein